LELARNREPDTLGYMALRNKPNCEYCGEPAVATLGWPGDFRWCEACQRDLQDFAKIEVPKGMGVDISDPAAISRYRAEMGRREADFMHQRVKERRSK
jgi:hypothetical protein